MADSEIRVGVVGTGGWANAGHMAVYDTHPGAKLIGVCDIDKDRARAAARMFDAEIITDDYNELVNRDDIDAIDIVTPNALHSPIALAALAAGKNVICEKPMAMNQAEAKQMLQAAADAGTRNGVNFVYRNHPAARFARYLIDKGHIGRIFHVNAFYMQGWLVYPRVPVSWRLQKSMTGTGVLGDLGSHIIDLVEWLTGNRITSVVADMQTFVDERPLAVGSGTGQVDVDDGATFLTRFDSGAMGSFVSSRYATARGNYQRIEIYGEEGALVYQWEDTDHIQACLGPALVRESQWVPMLVPERFKPRNRAATHKYGTTENISNFIDAIAMDREMIPGFQDGYRNQQVLDAVAASAQGQCWIKLPVNDADLQ